MLTWILSFTNPSDRIQGLFLMIALEISCCFFIIPVILRWVLEFLLHAIQPPAMGTAVKSK
jgi:hypothetical protein